MEEQWLKKLKERSENFEHEVPSGLWESIQHAIDEQKSASRDGMMTQEKQVSNKPAVIVWLRRMAAVAAAVLLAVIAFVALRDDAVRLDGTNVAHGTHSNVVARGGGKESADEEEADRLLIAEDNKARESGSGAEVKMRSEILPDKVAADTVTSIDATGTTETMPKHAEGKSDSVAHDSVDADKSPRSVFDNVKQKSSRSAAGHDYEAMAYNRSDVQSGRWSMNLYASNMSGNNNSSYGYRNFTMGGNPFSTMPKQETWTTGAMANIMFNNLNAETETKVNHQLPLHVGASVKYGITDRWGVETGLTYTLLKSDLTSGSDRDYYATEQSLHYIGIPLNVSFTVWRNKRFNVYVSAGGTMDIPLSGKTVTDYVNSGRVVDSENGTVDIDRLQWSVSGGVGVQYNIIDKLGVYVEPGVKYYFDDGSDVLTIYKDKPCNFNLQVGLRFTLN